MLWVLEYLFRIIIECLNWCSVQIISLEAIVVPLEQRGFERDQETQPGQDGSWRQRGLWTAFIGAEEERRGVGRAS